jgi:hypothetical protein
LEVADLCQLAAAAMGDAAKAALNKVLCAHNA